MQPSFEEMTGVLRKHQKLICKGKVLEAQRSILQQAVKGGVVKPGMKVTVMLMASTGGGGGAPPPPKTAGQVALAASRAAKAAKLAEDKSALAESVAWTRDLNNANAKGEAARERGAREARAAAAAARRAAWVKTGIVGLRATGIDEVPQEVWALGEAVRVADFFGNRISALPAAVASLAAVTRVRLSDNKLTSPGVAGLYSCCMQCTAVECS